MRCHRCPRLDTADGGAAVRSREDHGIADESPAAKGLTWLSDQGTLIHLLCPGQMDRSETRAGDDASVWVRPGEPGQAG